MLRRASRPLAVLLCGSVLLQGCATDQQRVEHVRELVRPGMSKTDVKAELGDPISVSTTTGGAGIMGTETWHYRFDAGNGNLMLDIMLGVLVVVVIVVIVAAACAGGGGGGGNLGGGWGGGGGGDAVLYEFDIHFDHNNRVDGISPVRTVAKG